MLKTYNIPTHFNSVFLFRGPATGKLYGMPGWVEVPEGTTIEQLILVQPEHIKRAAEEPSILIKEFKATKSDDIWQVTLKGKEYSCTCTGFAYRRSFQGNARICKHIKQVLSGSL
jgi:hypothetical protein